MGLFGFLSILISPLRTLSTRFTLETIGPLLVVELGPLFGKEAIGPGKEQVTLGFAVHAAVHVDGGETAATKVVEANYILAGICLLEIDTDSRAPRSV